MRRPNEAVVSWQRTAPLHSVSVTAVLAILSLVIVISLTATMSGRTGTAAPGLASVGRSCAGLPPGFRSANKSLPLPSILVSWDGSILRRERFMPISVDPVNFLLPSKGPRIQTPSTRSWCGTHVTGKRLRKMHSTELPTLPFDPSLL